MATAAMPSDDPSTARDRAEYLRMRTETPVMSLASENKVRNAMATGNPEAVRAARIEAGDRAALEDKAIGSMPTADFKAFHKAASEGSYSTAGKLLDAAVASYGRQQAVQPHTEPAPNIIEPFIAVERDSTPPSPREADTESLRAMLIERHSFDPTNSDKPTTDRSNRDRISVEREVIGRMSSDELQDYQAAREQGRVAAKATLDAARQRLRAVVDGKGVRALPPLTERFNVIRFLLTKDYEFRDQPGKLAFSERPFSMRTSVDHPAAVKAMVERAMERGWKVIRISGSTEFQRQAWIAATARGIKAVGHQPTHGDHEAARRERERMALDRSAASARAPIISKQQSATRPLPASARDRQMLVALDKAMSEGKVPAALRDRLREHVRAESVRRTAQGHRVAVKVYDPAAPRTKVKTPDLARQRAVERERSQ